MTTRSDRCRAVLTADADEARTKFQRLLVRFEGEPPPASEFSEAKSVRREGRTLELIVNGEGDRLQERLQSLHPASLSREALTLEEIFLASVK